MPRLSAVLVAMVLLFAAGCERGPDRDYRAAEALMARGRTQLARIKLESLLAEHPDHATATLALADLAMGRNDFEAAERWYAHRVELASGDFDSWIKLGRARLAGERWDGAIDAFTRAESAGDGRLQPMMARLWVREATELAAAQREVYRIGVAWASAPLEAKKDFVRAVNLRLRAAEAWSRLDFPEQARRAWEDVFQYSTGRMLDLEARLRAHPSDLGLQMELAEAELAAARRWGAVRKNREQMEEHLRRADPLIASVIHFASQQPKLRAEAAATAVSLYLLRARLDDALQWIDRAIEWDPDEPSYRYTRAQVQRQRWFKADALATMRELVADTTGTAEQWQFLAELERDAQHYPEARAAAEEAAARAAEDEVAPRFLLVELHLALGDVESASRELFALQQIDLFAADLRKLFALEQQLAELRRRLPAETAQNTLNAP